MKEIYMKLQVRIYIRGQEILAKYPGAELKEEPSRNLWDF